MSLDSLTLTEISESSDLVVLAVQGWEWCYNELIVRQIWPRIAEDAPQIVLEQVVELLNRLARYYEVLKISGIPYVHGWLQVCCTNAMALWQNLLVAAAFLIRVVAVRRLGKDSGPLGLTAEQELESRLEMLRSHIGSSRAQAAQSLLPDYSPAL